VVLLLVVLVLMVVSSLLLLLMVVLLLFSLHLLPVLGGLVSAFATCRHPGKRVRSTVGQPAPPGRPAGPPVVALAVARGALYAVVVPRLKVPLGGFPAISTRGIQGHAAVAVQA
jgi:hypothetical protein